MAINFDRQIREYLDTVKIDIQSELRSQSLMASGNAFNSLRVVANKFLIGELRGVVYLNFLIRGFKGKPKNVSTSFIDNIIAWMGFKGVQPQRDGLIVEATENNIRRSAFAIAKGITETGTRITRGEAGIPLNRILKDNLPKYLEGVQGQLLVSFQDSLEDGT